MCYNKNIHICTRTYAYIAVCVAASARRVQQIYMHKLCIEYFAKFRFIPYTLYRNCYLSERLLCWWLHSYNVTKNNGSVEDQQFKIMPTQCSCVILVMCTILLLREFLRYAVNDIKIHGKACARTLTYIEDMQEHKEMIYYVIGIIHISLGI